MCTSLWSGCFLVSAKVSHVSGVSFMLGWQLCWSWLGSLTYLRCWLAIDWSMILSLAGTMWISFMWSLPFQWANPGLLSGSAGGLEMECAHVQSAWRLGLRTDSVSLLPYCTGRSKSYSQSRWKEWGSRPLLSMGGAAKPHCSGRGYSMAISWSLMQLVFHQALLQSLFPGFLELDYLEVIWFSMT